jgi:hypothetical protein
MDSLTNEIFVIATNRRDGGLPDPVKIIDGEIFHDENVATDRFADVKEDMGDTVGLYRALISMAARLDAPSTAEAARPTFRDLRDDQLFSLLAMVYRSGTKDPGFSDQEVMQQVREDVQYFMEDELGPSAEIPRY